MLIGLSLQRSDAHHFHRCTQKTTNRKGSDFSSSRSISPTPYHYLHTTRHWFQLITAHTNTTVVVREVGGEETGRWREVGTLVVITGHYATQPASHSGHSVSSGPARIQSNVIVWNPPHLTHTHTRIPLNLSYHDTLCHLSTYRSKMGSQPFRMWKQP